MSSDKIQIRLRYSERADSVPLCEAPIDALDEVVRTVHAWGVAIDGNVFDSAAGQFVLENDCCFFEVIIHDDDD